MVNNPQTHLNISSIGHRKSPKLQDWKENINKIYKLKKQEYIHIWEAGIREI